MNCPHGLDPIRCVICCKNFPEAIASGKADRVVHKLATCTHAEATAEGASWCSVCGAHRSAPGEWQLTFYAMASQSLDAMFTLGGVDWGAPSDDYDEAIE